MLKDCLLRLHWIRLFLFQLLSHGMWWFWRLVFLGLYAVKLLIAAPPALLTKICFKNNSRTQLEGGDIEATNKDPDNQKNEIQ